MPYNPRPYTPPPTKEFLVDGKPEQREYSIQMMGQRLTASGVIPDLPQIEPETRSNETVIRRIDGTVEIITIR